MYTDEEKAGRKAYRAKLKAAGICMRCAQRNVKKGLTTMCEVCQDYYKQHYRNKEGYRERMLERQKRKREEWLAAGLCVVCGKAPQQEGVKSCANCRQRNIDNQRKYFAKRKAKAGV